MAGDVWQAARHSARTIRAGLLSAFATPPDADALLESALSQAGLILRLRPPGDPLLSGAHAVLDVEAETVWVRADVSPHERRLFAAHELGHFHLHEGGAEPGGGESGNGCFSDADAFSADPNLFATVGYGPRQRRETEANVWAREFLLPAPDATRWFADEGLTASAIAVRAGLPVGVVYGQMAAGLLASFVVPLTPNNGGTEGASTTTDGPSAKAEAFRFPPLLGVRGTDDLDPSQQAAAHAPPEHLPLLVGAGPGTGKTRTLIARLRFLMEEKNVAPENILALTFSRRAAEEMRQRIAVFAPHTAHRLFISTFHAYGLDLLRRHGTVLGLPVNPIVLQKADACALLEKHLAECDLEVLRYLHDFAFPLPDILGVISRAKEDLIRPEAFAVRALASGEPKLIETARVFAVYEKLLHRYGALDMSDLVGRAVRLLEENADVRAAEQGKFRHVLVDEYQDVNRAGAKLLQALTTSASGGLWAVGDIRQAIYKFRGASPANLTRFEADFPTGRRTDLAVNYRSRPPLVSLFGVACGEGEKTWQAFRPLSESVHAILAVAPDETIQAQHIARRMRMFVESGYHWDDIAVLCRSNAQVRSLCDALLSHGVPVAAPLDAGNTGGFLAHPDVQKLLALLSRAVEPDGAAAHTFPNLPPGLPPDGGDAFDFWAEALWGDCGMARTIENPADVALLLSLARGFRDRAALLMPIGDDPRRAFLDHLRRMARLGASFGDREQTGETGENAVSQVRVMTVHAAKGLEFPVVFVPNLSVGKFPSRGRPAFLPPLPAGEEDEETGTAFEEEARLFFVALTRAQDYLVLSRAEKYNNRAAQPSPLLACLDSVEGVGWEFWEASAPTPLPHQNGEGGANPRLNGANVKAVEALLLAEGSADIGSPFPILMGEGGGGRGPHPIETWEIDLYLRCPRRYYFARVLEIPTGDRDPYSAFKKAAFAALAAPDPAEAFAALWDIHGVPASHPFAALYKQAAEEIVTRRTSIAAANAPPVATSNLPAVLQLTREDGNLSVRPDIAEDGMAWEFRTFRKPPSRGAKTAGAELRFAVVQEALQAGGASGAVSVQLRYLQTGDVLPAPDKPAGRQKLLAEADRALRGIRLRQFDALPAEPSDCPTCPYFFICPQGDMQGV